MSAESDEMFAEYRAFRRRFNENLGRPAVLPEVEVVEVPEPEAKIYYFPERPDPNPEDIVA